MRAPITRQHRTRCRLPCTVRKGTKRVRARVLDVCEGGLCVVAPVRFQHKMTVQIEIEHPRHGPIEVEAVVWHVRRFRQPSSGREGWAVGLVLSKGGPDFQALASPGSVWEKPAEDALEALRNEASKSANPDPPAEDELELDEGPSVYRVRVRAVGTPRIRTLTLSATSEEAVREAVLTALEGEWQVLDVKVDPL